MGKIIRRMTLSPVTKIGGEGGVSQFKVVKLVNYIEYYLGEVLPDHRVQVEIDAGVIVTIQEVK